jgi:hypothetical protein
MRRRQGSAAMYRFGLALLAMLAGANLVITSLTEDRTDEGWTEQDQILLGRVAVTTRGCPDCHGGVHPAGAGYLAGLGSPEDAFLVGEYRVWARNLSSSPSAFNTRGPDRFPRSGPRYVPPRSALLS